MARLRDSWRTSLPVAQQPRNPQSESIAWTPYELGRCSGFRIESANADGIADAPEAVYRPGFSGHKILLCDRPYWGECGEPFAPGLSGAAVGILLQQPVLVIARDEGPDRGANLLGIAEDPAPHDLLLEGADEPLRHTVGLGM